ncbi:acid phosphatase AphA [Mergibacter septicus]|uniref:Class B acid phosphatase n=1 Tax=Mergibacter septicus TaxID=221402 RepID=A0A8D4LKN9_9PAST|nr:acid phosphatase AphA [Mergibacter septicus]AWX16115.1 acid phosphatase AphA [Mergibacter septicus]QDJ15368.1 acid phosphatase AphA [Mergibacter septicus]UTU48762.1 acid phosphatase AphA [Mergibacter septicus]WMR95606.1 acid phosphatase AphA [Mergibacter septicus]
MFLKIIHILLMGILFVFSPVLFAKGPKVPYSHPGITANDRSQENKVRMVSVEDIEKSLEGYPPMTVGFDIDDTVLVSSQCFYYGKNKWSPDSYAYLRNQAFWDYVADGCDLSSIPKESAEKLIAMHLKRGDQIIFLTGRTPHSGYDGKDLDKLALILQSTFHIPNMKPILYSRATVIEPYKYDKTPYIKDVDIKLYYGDSDSDILAAKEAGIRGIRVIRSSVSTNRPLPLNGGYGEEVVKDSWY